MNTKQSEKVHAKFGHKNIEVRFDESFEKNDDSAIEMKDNSISANSLQFHLEDERNIDEPNHEAAMKLYDIKPLQSSSRKTILF